MNPPENPTAAWTFSPSGCIEQPAHSPTELGQRIHSVIAQQGLAAVGCATASELAKAGRALDAWLAAGYHGTMEYLRSPERNGARRHDPRSLFAAAASIVVVAARYGSEPADSRRLPLLGQVAGYAHGPDYHGSLRHALGALGQSIADHSGRTIAARACVDTAPLLEREAARIAGLGFIGKSNMLIVPGVGSRVLLGALLVDVEIAPDAPHGERCGRCDACLRACPTQAFVGPWLLDARRCISYFTIEYRGWIPLELRPLIGTRVFGCDECQDVCPYNRGGLGPGPNRGTQVPVGVLEPGPNRGTQVPVGVLGPGPNRGDTTRLRDQSSSMRGEDMGNLSPSQHGRGTNVNASGSVVEALQAWLRMTSSDYRRLTAGSAMRRTSRAQLLRNAAVAAGNARSLELVEPLRALLLNSTYPIVRGHAAWALGRLGALEVLRCALASECDEQVRAELDSAMARSSYVCLPVT